MTYIPRMLDTLITERLNRGMAILVLGARRTGKTTLLEHLIHTTTLDVAYLNGDNDFDVALFETVTPSIWNQVLGNKRAVFIDEAQHIPNIGRAVKLLIEGRNDVQVFISGPSSFQVMKITEEPLTGSKYEYTLHPFSFSELSAYHGVLEEKRRLEERLLFGSYPQIVTEREYAQEHLMLLSERYLYRDLFAYDGLRKPKVLENLLKALAYRLGSELSPSELGSLLGVHRATVESYLSLLEQAHIIFRLPSYSTNLRNEIRKSSKYYFWDTGVRNAIIGRFDPIPARDDVGPLWENYLVSERRKLLSYHRSGQQFFWRTTDGMEVDYIEQTGGTIKAFEFEYSETKKSRVTRAFTNRYPEVEVTPINRANYTEFLLSV